MSSHLTRESKMVNVFQTEKCKESQIFSDLGSYSHNETFYPH